MMIDQDIIRSAQEVSNQNLDLNQYSDNVRSSTQ